MNTIKKAMIFILLLGTFSSICAETKKTLIKELDGDWKFQIGDNQAWANPNFDDSDWDRIKVPSPWEDKGYHGYDGYAWYRTKFSIEKISDDNDLYLSLGYIDDVAEIYLNGKIIGMSGSLPPTYKTAYDKNVWISIPHEILYESRNNLIAVRVFDSGGAGGIYSGDIGIYKIESPFELLIDLKGKWKFKTGDNQKWGETDYDDTNWDEIKVPSRWETQGYSAYDGFAWYRKEFNINKKFSDGEFVLVLGKIDDIDEVYLNGKLIGSTGDLIITPITNKFNYEFQKLRGYYISGNDLNKVENVIAVRVYDGFLDGGIYEGPIGITTMVKYKKFHKNSLKKKKNFIDVLFGD